MFSPRELLSKNRIEVKEPFREVPNFQFITQVGFYSLREAGNYLLSEGRYA